MTSSFPLFTGTYSINARRYRKTPYQLKKLAENDKAASYQQEKFVDTPDYYEDEPDFGCMAPPGLPALKSKSKKQKVEKEESVTSTGMA
uniref:Uncharacterized protein n=1 Tax=Caenorhabditis japonica TaxID=281687 RepID=A0A8R1INK8_CAEJA